MEFYTDSKKALPLIEESIRAFGYAAEHNASHYACSCEGREKPVFVRFPDASGLLAFSEEAEWRVFSEPVAAKNRRIPILVEFLENVFGEQKIKKVWLELHAETRGEFLKTLPQRFRANPVNYALHWPVFNLAAFNPELPGGHFKDLRNAKNKFYREHRVEVIDARGADKKHLHAIPDAWKKMRRARDRTHTEMYRYYIDNGFAGTASARALVVDGHVAGINAGWPVANNGKTYYAAIGLHDYSFKDLGDILNLEDLAYLKQSGYAYADFAGGEKALTDYKLKFGEAAIYTSYVFSVVRK